MKKLFGLAAVAGLLLVAAPFSGANAMSLANPGAAAVVKHSGTAVTTEVHWRGRGWHRGWDRGRHRGWRHRHWHHRHW